ncbi:MAG: hypothetical protein QME48_06390 [bacterium]|uniref:NADH:quinone oxidoreductase/Mrp antiporter membrane subunit domain-containing protein n=2 Tax=Bacteria candidate phyla TaxID=1783234 RepID=A0A101I2Z4_UNCT6|nr:MAG: hypothetical protein XD76_0143 [candidate division TA06 bacterium 32_111]KUK88041.1 MAG: hypothetical protein XE03_0047 [candidate division TA06 bacterium 34_109]MDI6700845.1 hypothetical protein [bacterium]HAF06969.1 hypothetical protein [candidate division WOR-3 bacterium]HCP16883.1 hypothetical protein [candidate division WOR-3 bacterium]
MNSVYFYSTIISVISIYILGNLSRVLRNIFVLIFFSFSFLYFSSIDNSIFVLKLFGFESLNLTFSKTSFSLPFLLVNHILFFFFFLREMFRNFRESENSYFMNISLVFVLLNLIFVSSDFITIYIFFELLFFLLVIMITININDYKNSENILLVNLFGTFILLAVIVVITSSKKLPNYPPIFYIILYISVALRTLVLPLSIFLKKELVRSDHSFIGIFILSVFLSGFFVMIFLFKNFLFTQYHLPALSKFFIYIFFLITLPIFSFDFLISNDTKRTIFSFAGLIFVTNLLIYLYYADFSLKYLMNSLFYFIPLSFIFIYFDYIEEEFKTSNFNFLGNLFKIKPVSSTVIFLSLISLSFLYPTSGYLLLKDSFFDSAYNPFPIFIVYLIYFVFYSLFFIKIFYLLFIQKNTTRENKITKESELILSFLSVPFLVLFLFSGILLYAYGTSPLLFLIIFFLLTFIFVLIVLILNDQNWKYSFLSTKNSEEYFFVQNRKITMIGDLLNSKFDISLSETFLEKIVEKTDVNKIFYFLKNFIDNFSLTLFKLYQRSFTASFFILLLFLILFFTYLFYRGFL